MDPDASLGDEHGSDPAQGRRRTGVKAFDGLREPTVPLGLDRADEVPRFRGRSLSDLLDRPVIIGQDPPHLLVEEDERAPPECLDVRPSRFEERSSGEPIGSLEVRKESRESCGPHGRRDGVEIDRPGFTLVRRNRERVEALALFVGQQGDAEREEEKPVLPRLPHLSVEPSFRAEACVRERTAPPVRLWVH